jgi:hypothetical protein
MCASLTTPDGVSEVEQSRSIQGHTFEVVPKNICDQL